MKKLNVVVAEKATKLGKFLNKHAATIALVALMTVTMASMVFASNQQSDPAEQLWSQLSTVITKWVRRLGGVIMLIGGIQVGIGWQNDDSARKSAGFNTIIAGAIVLAVAALAGTFFNI